MQAKEKNMVLVLILLIVIIVSLYLAYSNGVIGKAIVQSVAG